MSSRARSTFVPSPTPACRVDLRGPLRGLRFSRVVMNQMRMGFCISSAAMAAAEGMGRAWQRNMSTVSKAKEIIEGKKGKNHKATSELCNFLGIPHQYRSEMALTLSKFMKL